MRTVRFARLVAALAVVIGAVTPTPAWAQSGDRQVAMTVVDQTTWVRADQRFDIRVRVESKRPDRKLELALTVFGRVPFRSQFAQTVDGRLLGSVLAHSTVPIAEANPTPDGIVTATVVPPLRRPGVYPVRVELRDVDEEDPLARVTTHLIHLPDAEYAAPLLVAPILPIDASPVTRTDGDARVAGSRASGLNAIGQALQARPRVAASLLPVPETLEAMAGGASGSPERAALSSLNRATSGLTVLPASYVPAGLGALLGAGLEQEAEVQMARGRSTAERLLDRDPSTDTWVDGGDVDPGAVEWLRERGFSQFVLQEDTLEPVRLSTTLTAPFELAVPGGDRPLAASVDPGLAVHFAANDQPVVAAHQLLADLAVVYFDHPGREGRGVVVAPPREWRPNAEFLAALLTGLADSPILSSTTMDRFFADVPPATSRGDVLTRRLQGGGGDELPVASIEAARRRLDSFGTLLETDNDRHLDFERLILASQTTGMSAARRAEYLRGFHRAIDKELTLVEIPAHQSIRLTAREGDIPIAILSRTGYPVRVLVRVEGDTLEFPQGGERLVSLTHETTTERVPVQARGSGAFPLRVTVLSPDGGLAVAASRFTVTSTTASWVALVLSAGAALFLIAWWGRHIHGRRAGKLVPT